MGPRRNPSPSLDKDGPVGQFLPPVDRQDAVAVPVQTVLPHHAVPQGHKRQINGRLTGMGMPRQPPGVIGPLRRLEAIGCGFPPYHLRMIESRSIWYFIGISQFPDSDPGSGPLPPDLVVFGRHWAISVVVVAPLPIHADLDRMILKDLDELPAGEPAALLGVEHLGPSLFQRLRQSLDAKVGFRSVGQSPGHHLPDVPANDRNQVEESHGYRQVGDDSYQTWVGSGDLGVLQQTIPAALNPPEQSRYTAAGLSQRVGLGSESVT